MGAGLVGMEQDARYGLAPKIGWLVRRSEDEAQVLNELVTKTCYVIEYSRGIFDGRDNT